MQNFSISGNVVDVLHRFIFPATINVENGVIVSIICEKDKNYDLFIMPGFVDSHVHIESSMLIPSEFARLATPHGTVATVSDPHEIGNILGIEGVRYMIQNGKQTPFKFYFGAPSCVPATIFETAGAEITPKEIRALFEEDGLVYLSEMMNFPGVLFGDSGVMEKLEIAKSLGRKIDGHAPGLRGSDAEKYVSAGISTDHECYSLEEALEKISFGMKILIREGSAAKNFSTLHPLIGSHPSMVMLCSDDKHPNDLATGHINELASRAVALGYDVFDVLQCSCVNPVQHYGLNVGLLQPGDSADFIVVNSLEQFTVNQAFIAGKLVAEDGKTLISSVSAEKPNNFRTKSKIPEDFRIADTGKSQIRVIEALEGQLITNELVLPKSSDGKFLLPDVESDILKLAVVNRYDNSPCAVAFIRNFGLKSGALASCVAHDSHNIIAVGTSDEEICAAVNGIISAKGGISVAVGGKIEVLELPVAGIMSAEDGYIVAEKYSKLDALAKELGTSFHSPFMTLSFMALLVIPALKLSDKGLFDGTKFEFTEIMM